jgi:hypothetical protein
VNGSNFYILSLQALDETELRLDEEEDDDVESEGRSWRR